MKLKNLKDKFSFIDALFNDDNESILKKTAVIQKLSFDKNPEVRIALARQLVFFDGDEIEEILYQMLFDKNRWVRLEAVDSLAIGRQKKTIEKVKIMVGNEGGFIRAYAVLTLFDLITNRYGVNNEAYSLYEKYVSEYFVREKHTQALLAYYQNRFYLNNEDGLRLLENAYIEAVEENDYKSIWLLLHIFGEIQNYQNQQAIYKIVNFKIEKLLPAQRKLVLDIITREVPKKILIVDQNDVYLTHVVSGILNSIKDSNMEIKTAGLNIGTVQQKEIRNFCDRHGIRQKDSYVSHRMMNAYLYDVIISLNGAISKDKYSLCNVICFDGLDMKNDYEIIDTCHTIKRLLEIM